jgi:dethiobiotin synthetase
VVLSVYGPAVSPHLAAELAGSSIDAEELRTALLDSAGPDDVLIVEGVGGLLVPITAAYDVRALARELDLPVLIAARAGLGTINHTLLTIEAARNGGLQIEGVILTPWPASPDLIQASNRETIQRLGEVPVWTLPLIARGEPELLASAGRQLLAETGWLLRASSGKAAALGGWG